MKKILCLFLVLVILFSFAGCAAAVPEENPNQEYQELTSMFVKLETFRASSGGGTYVFYHKDTKVMYIVSYEGVATVMLNPDGTPQTYSN